MEKQNNVSEEEQEKKDKVPKNRSGVRLVSVVITFILFFVLGFGFRALFWSEHGTKDEDIEECTGEETYYNGNMVDGKPVIYLYSDEDNKEVSVSLDTDFEITCEYPKRQNGVWKVRANKDGILRDELGIEYNYLYWEGLSNKEYDFSTGFCIKGSDSAEFLESSLAQLGLSREEANEFIVYWLPILEANKYNLISFQTTEYTDRYKLGIEPSADNVLRVFMAVKGLDEPTEITRQDLDSVRGDFVREGFCVVEWGGSVIDGRVR